MNYQKHVELSYAFYLFIYLFIYFNRPAVEFQEMHADGTYDKICQIFINIVSFDTDLLHLCFVSF